MPTIVRNSGGGITQEEYDAIVTDRDTWKNNYNTLNTRYNTLNTEYTNYKSTHGYTNTQYNNLNTKYNTLNNNYTALQTEYNTYKTNHKYTNTQYDDKTMYWYPQYVTGVTTKIVKTNGAKSMQMMLQKWTVDSAQRMIVDASNGGSSWTKLFSSEDEDFRVNIKVIYKTINNIGNYDRIRVRTLNPNGTPNDNWFVWALAFNAQWSGTY